MALAGIWYYYVFFVDKRDWAEFGIITCFLWIKGTGLSLVLLRVFVDKRHCSEFGIITCFLWIKGTWVSLVLLPVFCRRKALA